jgi:hypothetical protein
MQHLQTGPILPQSLSVVAREYLDVLGSLCTYGAKCSDEREVYACLRVLTDIPAALRRRGLHVPPLGAR